MRGIVSAFFFYFSFYFYGISIRAIIVKQYKCTRWYRRCKWFSPSPTPKNKKISSGPIRVLLYKISCWNATESAESTTTAVADRRRRRRATTTAAAERVVGPRGIRRSVKKYGLKFCDSAAGASVIISCGDAYARPRAFSSPLRAPWKKTNKNREKKKIPKIT